MSVLFIIFASNSPFNTIFSSVSSTSSDWGVKEPLIQLDSGSNITTSPSSPFNLPVGLPSASDMIEVANRDSNPV